MQSELSPIDTAIFIAGALFAAEYYQDPEITKLARQLYERIDFPWMQNGTKFFALSWTPEKKFSKNVQQGDDLGSRMFNAFNQVSDYDKKIIIGSDCLGITQQLIEQAYTHLDFHDVVIGPSEDGGFYLLGMNVLIPELFQNI